MDHVQPVVGDQRSRGGGAVVGQRVAHPLRLPSDVVLRPDPQIVDRSLIFGTDRRSAREGIAVWQEPTGRINSANLPWTFQVDFKAERKIQVAQFSFTPYVWVKNLFENENIYNVYEGSGEPDVTGWLETGEGEFFAESNGEDAVESYRFKSQNPKNYGEPRIIYFGLRMSF